MTREPDSSRTSGEQITTVDVGHRAQVIVLRGAIRGSAVDDLRERLLAAIAAGVREIFLDLIEVESITSPVHDLVSAASITLADRGGVLLVWSRRDAVGEATYVIADVRDRALAELMPSSRGSIPRDRGPA
jgi:anti-anti-sigma regulatory factor